MVAKVTLDEAEQGDIIRFMRKDKQVSGYLVRITNRGNLYVEVPELNGRIIRLGAESVLAVKRRSTA